MRPFILNYMEKVKNETSFIDINDIIYDHNLNLTIHRTNGMPIISHQTMSNSTVTFSKTGTEAQDTDYNNETVLSTMTKTDTQKEGTDSDPGSFSFFMATHTFTETNKEPTDSDK